MAYEIIGRVYRIGAEEQIATKNGGTMRKRALTLELRRYDPYTGQEYQSNYPEIEFSNQGCDSVGMWAVGEMVRVRFDVQGTLYKDKATGETRNYTRLRGFKVERYVSPTRQEERHVEQAVPAPKEQAAPAWDDEAPF